MTERIDDAAEQTGAHSDHRTSFGPDDACTWSHARHRTERRGEKPAGSKPHDLERQLLVTLSYDEEQVADAGAEPPDFDDEAHHVEDDSRRTMYLRRLHLSMVGVERELHFHRAFREKSPFSA